MNGHEKSKNPTAYRLGRKLAHLRAEKLMSQRELAEKAGLIQNQVYIAESGKHNTGVETLGRLLDILGYKLTIIEKKCGRPKTNSDTTEREKSGQTIDSDSKCEQD